MTNQTCKTCGKPVTITTNGAIHEGGGMYTQRCDNPACGWVGGQYGSYQSCPSCGRSDTLKDDHVATI